MSKLSPYKHDVGSIDMSFYVERVPDSLDDLNQRWQGMANNSIGKIQRNGEEALLMSVLEPVDVTETILSCFKKSASSLWINSTIPQTATYS